jgi:hypothetical protein
VQQHQRNPRWVGTVDFIIDFEAVDRCVIGFDLIPGAGLRNSRASAAA